MKKRSMALLLAAMMIVAAGCGDNKNGESIEGTEGTENIADTEGAQTQDVITAASSMFELKGSDYVQLCDYSALELAISGEYEVQDGDAEDYFEQMFAANGPFYMEDTSATTIGDGAIVNVDYVGKLNGEAFDGGSAQQQLIDVDNNCAAGGAGSYIDGFTEGLKGASVGDVIDCDVTFPETYSNADLAGKPVVFTFTVNSIQKEMTVADVDDTFAQEQFQVETVDDMYAQIRTYLEQSAEYNKQRDTYTAAQDYLIENSTVSVPEDYVEARLADYKRQFVDANCEGDESQFGEYATTYYGKTAEELEQSWSESMAESVKLELIMDAIAEKLGLSLDEEAFTTNVSNMATNNGYSDLSQMYALYGYGDAAYGETYLKKLYLYDEALDKILETANVTVTEPEEAEVVENTENE